MLRTILIVDDNKTSRIILRSILSTDYDVIEATGGFQALRLLKEYGTGISAVLLDIVMPDMNGYDVLRHMQADPVLRSVPVIIASGATESGAESKALELGASDFVAKPYKPDTIRHRLRNTIRLCETAAIVNSAMRDDLTGLYTRKVFFEKAAALISSHEPGYYIIACFDIDNFKVINDQYGSAKGDEVLRSIARIFLDGFSPVGGICCRIMADNFAVLYPFSYADSFEIEDIKQRVSVLDGSIQPIAFSVGRYVVDDLSLPVSGMYDRATLAEISVKGHFDKNTAYYDESMRTRLLREQEITGEMKAALEAEQFEVWFQPQYNLSTDALIGSEALIRWQHPKNGIIMPGDFIPVFERNGFIYELDKYIWEHTCRLLRRWIDEGRSPLPVSVNVSRYDVFREDLIDILTGLLEQYGLPAELLRLEITESAFAKSADQIIRVVKRLIELGFTVEIDDFGSGYSSLNTLKDVPAQVLKLDMRFLEDNGNSDRGGNILESVVRMAKWLGMTTLAEGVETPEQATYLKSIGCNYVQGYLYSVPLQMSEYEALARSITKEEKLLTLETVKNLDNNAFWNPESMDTLIFNTYIGGACIFEWHNNKIEILRANDKYAKTVCGEGGTVSDALGLVWEDHMDIEASRLTQDAINRAISTGDDATYEAVYTDLPVSPGETCLRTTFRALARTTDRYLLYALNENITAQREAELRVRKTAEQMQAIMDNINSGVTAVTLHGKRAQMLFSNDKFYSLFGYTREQYDKEVHDPLDVILAADKQWVTDAVIAVIKSGHADTLEYRALRRDGTEFWLRNALSMAHFDGIDSPVQLGIFTDITEAKLAAQMLAETDDRLRELNAKIESDRHNFEEMMNDTPGGFARLRVLPDGNLATVYVNETFCRLRGLTYDEIISSDGENAMDTIHPDDADAVRAAISDMISTGKTCVITYRLKHGNGEYNPFNVFGRMTKNEHGEMFINVYYTELTEIERKDLTVNEILPYILSATMDHSTDLVYAKDKDFRYICCSPAFVRFAGQSSQADVIGKTDFDLFLPEYAEHFRASDLHLFEAGEPLINYVEPIPSNDDIRHYCTTSKYILRDATGAVIGLYGFGRDVTQERTAYEQLKLLTDSIPGGLLRYTTSPEGLKVTYFNDGICRMLGCTREEYAAALQNGVITSIFKEDIPLLQKRITSLITDGTPINCTYRLHNMHDDGYKWVNLRISNAEQIGTELSANAVLYDVTEHKLAEEAARIHEEELEAAMGKMGRIIGEFDVTSRTLILPGGYAEKHGIPAVSTNVPHCFEGKRGLSPEMYSIYAGLYEAAARGEKSGSAEIRLVDKSGEPCRLHIEFVTLFSEDGQPIKALFASDDRTNQHKLYEFEKSRPSVDKDRLIAHALFNLTTGETLEYFYADGSEVPPEDRTALCCDNQALDRLLADPEERELYRSVNDAAALLERFEKGETEISVCYKRLIPDGSIIWVRNQLRMMKMPGSNDVLLFEYYYDIDDEMTVELLYSSLVNINYDYVARIDSHTRSFSVMLNPTAADRTIPQRGSNSDDIVENIAGLRIHPDDRQFYLDNMLVDNIKRNLEKEEHFRFTCRMLNGDTLLYKQYVMYYLEKERNIIILTREDVTKPVFGEMKRNELLERALDAANEESRVKERRSAAQLQIIMNNVRGGVCAMTLNGQSSNILFANDEFFAMHGYTRESFGSLPDSDFLRLIHSDDRQHMLDALKKDTGGSAEYKAVKQDGSVIRVHCSGSVCSMADVDEPVYILVLNDVTKEKEAEDSLRISEEMYRIAASIGGRAISRYDIKTGTLYHNDKVLLAMGFDTVIENVPQSIIDMGNIAPESLDDYIEFYKKITRGESHVSMDLNMRVADGTFRWCRREATVIFDSDGLPSQAISVITDITDQREKETVYLKWQQSLRDKQPDTYTLFRCNLNSGLSCHAPDGSLWSFAFSEKARCLDDYISEFVSQRVYPDDRESLSVFMSTNAMLAGYYRGKRYSTIEFREMLPDVIRWRKVTVELVEYPGTTDIEAYIMIEDVDKSKREELLNKERAETDPLTGVLNRAAFAEAIERAISRRAAGCSLALLMLDMDGFKLINDTFGHAEGDQAIKDIASSLRSALRHGDILGRLGGDEFLVCLPDMPGDEGIERKARQLCLLLRRSFSDEVHLSASIGIAVCPRDGSDFASLYRCADSALYAVKNSAKDSYAFYGSAIEAKAETPTPRSRAVAPEGTPPTALEKRRILIAADRKDDLKLLSDIFSEDYIIAKAMDSVSTFTQLKHYGASVAAVLLDFSLPDSDSIGLLEEIRKNPELDSVPVIIISENSSRDEILNAVRNGAFDFIIKPVEDELIRLRVLSAVSSSENRRLKAQNSRLTQQADEIIRYRTVFDAVGAATAELDWLSGVFTYDRRMPELIAGCFDSRKLWSVLMSDMAASVSDVQKLQQLVHDVAENRDLMSGGMEAIMRTPSGEKHMFRISVYKRINEFKLAVKLVLTFVDTGTNRQEG